MVWIGSIPAIWIPAIPAGMTAFPAFPDLFMTIRAGAWEQAEVFSVVYLFHRKASQNENRGMKAAPTV